VNLDNAFERRFLFKLRFDKPSVDSRINIWNEKLPGRKEIEIRFLAENYEFSGGQIDNIVKKVLLDSVLNDETPSFELLKAFCEDELFKRGTESQKIGYSLF
jgi:hypothetical protein